MRKKTLFQTIFLFLGLILLISCAIVPITGRRQLSLVSIGELTRMSATQYTQLMQQSKINPDKVTTAMVRKVGSKIAASAEQFLRD
ncbi:MAG: M48 family peptidase, partial [bacterium]|nr:M48 family peptidase [bacterium]